MFTLGEAAREAGKSKTTLHRAIKSGRMSARKNADGSYQIDPAELFRVYEQALPETPGKPLPETPDNPPVTPDHSETVTALREQIDLLQTERRREREQLQARIDELSQSVADWKQQNNNTTLLLKNEQDSHQSQRGFWARLFQS